MKIKILHLYPDLLNLYGDKGNIECMRHRLEWRGIEAEVISHTSGSGADFDISDADIIFIGGGSEREQKAVCDMLLTRKDELIDYAENGGTIVAACGGYQILGKYTKTETETLNGLGILDIYSEQGTDRLIGNIVLDSDITDMPIVGFENHSERTYINNHTPLGKVLCGKGNTEKADFEGVVYKNVLATNLHGPLFPKNPQLCDYVLSKALKQKYPEFEGLSPLDDELEEKANKFIVERYCNE